MHTILFDLDGTLLPMVQEEFVAAYFGELAKKCAGFGYGKEDITAAVWSGTKAMVQNDGRATNEEVFWQVFVERMGPAILELKPEFTLFYANEFNRAQAATRPNPLAQKVVRQLRAKGYRVVLATNPLFPREAVHSRIGWLGLQPANFDYITSYENSHFCKPNPGYYEEILRNIGCNAAGCLMVGNDVKEDGCTLAIGMDFYLVTDDILNADGQDTATLQQGTFADFYEFAQGLPARQ